MTKGSQSFRQFYDEDRRVANEAELSKLTPNEIIVFILLSGCRSDTSLFIKLLELQDPTIHDMLTKANGHENATREARAGIISEATFSITNEDQVETAEEILAAIAIACQGCGRPHLRSVCPFRPIAKNQVNMDSKSPCGTAHVNITICPDLDDQPCSINNSDCLNLSSTHFECYEKIEEYSSFLRKANFFLHGITMFIVGLFGILGNILTIYVLNRIQTNRNFNRLLVALAVVDTSVIFFFVLDISICGQFLPQEPFWYRLLYPYFIHPIRNMTLSGSIFMVVAISAERYKAICQTFAYRPSSTKYILTVFITTVCLEVPRFLEFKLMDTVEHGLIYWTTHIMDNENFIQFSSYWDDILCTGLFPFGALLFFNTSIYAKIRNSGNHKYRFVGKTHTKESVPTRSLMIKLHPYNLPASNERHFRKKRAKSTALLIAIVLIFVFCHVYRLCVQSIQIYLSPQLAEDQFRYCHELGRHYAPIAIQILLMVNHVFIVVNSSINFIVYCLVGREFKAELMKNFQTQKLHLADNYAIHVNT
ncbi:hypothetical protein TCAL_15980 [Tigriopus californicus]|uniref:G-protein coupled receptors family 1 profile domain-containing protein n=1 Tax=Tigriopus californicus TaxID=6832 RepID=A0A553PFQ0_TIGCA|nr:hypothetical protein TCAL_15980 [Tigriopus californicus]